MTMDRLAGVLEDAVHSLTTLDAERLERLERELSAADTNSLFAVRETRQDDALRAVVATHRLLGTLLESTSMNLNVLEALRRRNHPGDGRWGR
jgi:hypothetical protein